MITIEVVNKSTVTLPQPLPDILEAIEQQISADFAPAWALEPALFTAVDEFTKGTGNYRMLIADDSTQADALGFHDYVDAEPIAYCFAKTTIDSGSLFSVTVCHESLEMLADPEICFASVFGTEILGLEVGDPVEDDALGYQVNGIQMSDFVLPSYFVQGSKGPWDFKSHLKAPNTLTDGGYQLVFSNGQWTQNMGRVVGRLAAPFDQHYARRQRRKRTGRDWKSSLHDSLSR